MARLVAISGVESPGGVSPRSAAIGWALIASCAVVVFVGTLLLRPKEG
jgi:hypothetical protein